MQWTIFFDIENALHGQSQMIPVIEHARQSEHATVQDSQFSLNKHELPNFSRAFVEWSASDAESKGVSDLQSALDAMISSMVGRPELPRVSENINFQA